MLKLAIFVLLLLTHTSAFVPHHSASCRRPSFLSVKTFDHFDMEELKKHLASWNLFETPRVPDRVYIITFQELEGYHSVEVESGRNVILAFESQQACAKFASRLKSQQFFNPTVRGALGCESTGAFELLEHSNVLSLCRRFYCSHKK